MTIKNPLTHYFNKAKQHYKADELDSAREYLDMGLTLCREFTHDLKEEMSDADLDRYDAFERMHKGVEFEGYSLETWKMRFWVKLENWGLLL